MKNAFEHHMSIERECVEFLRDTVEDLREEVEEVQNELSNWKHKVTKKPTLKTENSVLQK